MNKIGFIGGVKVATAIKRLLCVTLMLPLLPTQLSHMFVTLALVMEVARAFHTTIFLNSYSTY